MKYKCEWPGCNVESSVEMKDSKGNIYCAPHFQAMIVAEKEAKVQENKTPAVERKILHG